MTDAVSPADDDRPLIYVVAGEASGDVLVAGMMRELKRRTGGAVRFAGVGGERMIAEGLKSLFPVSELAVMGVFEILPHAPRLLWRIGQVVADAVARKPALVMTADSWAFTMRIQRRLGTRRRRGEIDCPLVHMVAPSVWAWRPGRARQIARWVDHLMVLFPFEPPYFQAYGLATTFIGHPAAGQPVGDGKAFRAAHAIPNDAPVLGVLPGSRHGEVERLLPVFGETVARLAARYPDLRVVVPTVDVVATRVKAVVADWRARVVITEGQAAKYDAFDAMTVALAASGTVTLELTLARVPTVVAYKISRLSEPIVRLLVNPDAVILTNRILERPVLDGYFQDDCTPERLSIAVSHLFDDQRARREMQAAGDEVRAHLLAGDEHPSAAAANRIADLAGIGRDNQLFSSHEISR